MKQLEVKETPIIFSTDMVKAILDGRKTQTRRIVSSKTSEVGEGKVDWTKFCWDGSEIEETVCIHGHRECNTAPLPWVDDSFGLHYLHVPYRWSENGTIFRIYPKWEVGDLLWVRETWGLAGWAEFEDKAKSGVRYKATDIVFPPWKWKPSIHMPKWACRIWLEITNVRVERLQEISHEDAVKEGAVYMGSGKPKDYPLSVAQIVFADYWNSLNEKRGYGWEVNPWVWVIEFKSHKNQVND